MVTSNLPSMQNLGGGYISGTFGLMQEILWISFFPSIMTNNRKSDGVGTNIYLEVFDME